MAGHYFIQGLFLLGGLIAVLASVLNWNWFFSAKNTQLIVKNVGRNRARLFYGISGLILMGMAIFFYLEVRR